MSWSLSVIPLHDLARDGMFNWIASIDFTRGLPDYAPAARPLPSVVEVLAAFQSAGCYGTNWFKIIGERAGSRLPEYPDSNSDARSGGFGLGQVRVYSAGRTSRRRPIPTDAPIERVSFRKPNTIAVLRAVDALASIAGPQLVFDHSATRAFVVRPGEDTGVLQDEWPW